MLMFWENFRYPFSFFLSIGSLSFNLDFLQPLLPYTYPYLSIKDVNLDTYMVEIKDTKVHLNGGYTEILRVWIDSEEIKNQPKLFPSLTYDNLEKQIDKLSRKFWGVEGKLVTRDFLSKVHVVEFARIAIELREQIDMQQLLLKNSPYKIDSRIIEKEISEAVNIHNQSLAAFF